MKTILLLEKAILKIMQNYSELIENKNITQIFLFGMYRSGTTVVARTLAGDSKIAFASDPIRPFFNYYRTKLQKIINPLNFENSDRPLGDYFNNENKYILKLLKSDFSEKISQHEVMQIRKTVISQGSNYSPKFIENLKKIKDVQSSNYADELKNYLSLIILTYGNINTTVVGLKEVWSIEMALPILNMIGKKAKILVVVRDPLDITASSINGKGNYSILSLARQWRKQIVFYNLLKTIFPDQVACICYEDFCKDSINTLKNSFEEIILNSHNHFSEKLKPIDDSGKIWFKNSSHNKINKSNKIDINSIGK